MTAFDPASVFADARPAMLMPAHAQSTVIGTGPAHAPLLDATNTTAASPPTLAVPLPGLKTTRLIKRVPVPAPPPALPAPVNPHAAADSNPPFRITSFPRIPPARASSANRGTHERRFPPADPHALVRLATDNLARIRYERELDALWRGAGLERAHAYATASAVEDSDANDFHNAEDQDENDDGEDEDEVEFSITPLPRTLLPCRPRLSPDPTDPYSHARDARRFPTLDAHALRRMAIENFAMQRDWELERWGADADADAVGDVYEDEDAYGGAYGGADGGDAYNARDAPPHMPARAATPNNRAPPPVSASSCSSSSCYDTDSSASASPSLSASDYDSDGDCDSDALAPQKPLPASPSQSRIAVRGHAAALFGRLLGTSARKGGACAAPAHVPVKSARRTSVCAQNGARASFFCVLE